MLTSHRAPRRHLALLITVAAISSNLAAHPGSDTVLYSFARGGGHDPVGGVVIGPSGVLYGTTLTGGTLNGGTAFELSPPKTGDGRWTETVLYNFDPSSSTLGFAPNAGLAIASSGVLFGTTSNAGTCIGGGCGSVFSLTPPLVEGSAWTVNVLHTFTGKVNTTIVDGSFPYASVVIAADGNIFGTTQGGGRCCGTVFELTPPESQGSSWSESVIYNFSGFEPDGVGPTSSLAIGSSGELYGTTVGGGQNLLLTRCGIVFQLTPPAVAGNMWDETIVHTFQDFPTDGHSPYAGLVISASGSLFGTTYYGGDLTACGSGIGCGTVFEIDPPVTVGGTWTESVIYNFGADSTDGAFPYYGNLVIGTGGVLYGTSSSGGVYGLGELFALTPPTSTGGTWSKKTVHSFGAAGDGAPPYAGVTFGPNGGIYGTTYAGGSSSLTCQSGCGAVFKVGR